MRGGNQLLSAGVEHCSQTLAFPLLLAAQHPWAFHGSTGTTGVQPFGWSGCVHYCSLLELIGNQNFSHQFLSLVIRRCCVFSAHPAFIYRVRKEDTWVSTKEMKPNASFSAGSLDSWGLTIAAEILPAKHCRLAGLFQGFGRYCVMQYYKKSQYPRQQFPTSGFRGVKLKCKLCSAAQCSWFWDKKKDGLLAQNLGNHCSNAGP